MQPGEFLQLLWSPALDRGLDGCSTVWLKQEKDSLHIPLADVAQWDAETDGEFLQLYGNSDIYTSPGLRRTGLVGGPRGQQGARRDVVALGAFVLDIDLRTDVGEAHKAKNLPLESDVGLLLEGVPDPTLVIHTGYGMHAWWLFREPFLTPTAAVQKFVDRAFENFQLPFIARAKEHGWHLDKTATIQRVFRLPGTTNWKRKSEPKPVEVIYRDGPRYAINELVDLKAAPAVKPKALTDRGDLPDLPKGANTTTLDGVRASLQRIKPDHEHYERVHLLLAGESFADRGERNAIMHKLVWMVANRGRTLPPEELAEIFRPSLEQWANEEDAEKDLVEELEVVVAMFERELDVIAEEDRQKAIDLSKVYRGLLRVGGKQVAEINNKTDGTPTLEKIITHDEVVHAALVQKGGYFWAFDFGLQQRPMAPGYYGPFIQKEILLRLKDSWNGSDDHALYYLKEKADGDVVEKRKTLDDVLYDYGSSALKLVSELTLQDTYFDLDDRTLHEAICPLRLLEPEFSEEIHEWLALLGGDKLIDWVSCVIKLDKACCALYLEGPPSVGKSLLVKGLSRLWRTTGPASFQSLMSGYNADAVGAGGCPLIELSEGLPKSVTATSSFIRNLVSDLEHTVNQKFEPMRKVVGAIRLAITANNDNILVAIANEELSDDDVGGTAKRFLHIKADDQAASWIQERNQGREMTTRWVEGDGIARHALWLAQNHAVAPGTRFLVEGQLSEIHRALVTRGDKKGVVLEWLARFMTEPEKVERFYKSKNQHCRVRIGNGKLMVNTQAVVDCWQVYSSTDVKLTTGMIGRVLAQISSSKQRARVNGVENVDKARFRFHTINTDYVIGFADGPAQIGDVVEMFKNLNREIAEEDDHGQD